MANEVNFNPGDNDDTAFEWEGGSNGVGSFWFGYDNDLSREMNGAVRFVSVSIPQGTTVNNAELRFPNGSKSGSSNAMAKVYGIDEDNTSDFGGGWPGGRTQTTAYNTHYADSNSFTIGVTSIVNEILGRGGWSSGNAMGFIVWNDNTNTGDNNYFAESNESEIFLEIRVNAEPNFKPTPKSVSAPTFPTAEDMGIRISKPGKNVLTDTDANMFFTTRKKTWQVYEEKEVTTSASPHTITHNLGYAPEALVYANSNGKRVRLNRMFSVNYTDPTGVNLEGYYTCNSTTMKIYVPTSTDIYYYIFIEPIELI